MPASTIEHVAALPRYAAHADMVTSRKRGESLTTKRRCGSCQQRHIKCEYDGNDDKCKACRASARPCIVRHRFQHVDPTAPKRTKMVSAGEQQQDFQPGFRIIQEYAELQSTSKDDSQFADGEDVVGQPAQLSPLPVVIQLPSATDVALSNKSPTADLHEPVRLSSHSSYIFPQNSSPNHLSSPSLNFLSPTSIPTPESHRLADKEKALLLRHFTHVLSRWFDVCDPYQHFRRIVPVKALTCPTLMKAISASSAWHLNRQGKFDQERSSYLYQNCLNHLIRLMDSPAVGTDDSVLVAAVIMHHVEELRDLEHTLNLETRGHLIGIHVFLDNQDPNMEPSSLRTAAFRTAMREEIHVCFVDQQPLSLPTEVCDVDRSFQETDDDTWAWRMILMFRDALAYSLSPSTLAAWDSLYADQQSWQNLRPASFNPTFIQHACPEEGRFLPEIWYLLDCHIIGAIHYQLCRLVLAISNPRTPKIGWNKAAAAKRVEEEVSASVIEICGIASANHLFPSAMTAASMVTTMCADSITDQNLQNTLLDILVLTRSVHAWPTEAAQKYVKSVWQAQQEQSPRSSVSARSFPPISQS